MSNINPATGDNAAVFARFDYSGLFPGASQIAGVNDSPRFVELAPLYREFAITGLKIEIVPANRQAIN